MSELLLSWYGDDFTGSTDVMEALTLAGVPAVLFLEPPGPEDLRAFPGCRAIGVAGTSRAMTPERMDRELPPVFERLRALGAPMVHYKLCSTFDSSPRIGSVGRAIEIGRRVFGGAWTPLVVGAPALRRYTLFGNLFATADGVPYRIDRHPTMSRHPVTPMDEADLRVHLAKQTAARTALFDLLQLSGSPEEVDRRLEALLRTDPEIVLFDVLDDARLETLGRLLWTARPPFVAGSSGIEYALAAHWRSAGIVPGHAALSPPGAADRLLVVSGSCSPVTEGQIGWALEHGFEGVPLDPGALLSGGIADAIRRALDALGRGRNAVLYTARGPEDPRILDALSVGERLGMALGEIAAAILAESHVRRLVVAGGDTSGWVTRRLGLYALEMAVPIAPGSPLCRARVREPRLDGLEVALKGGQVGRTDYFGSVLRGAA